MKETKQILITNATILTMNQHCEIYKNASLLIENNLIKEIGKIDPQSFPHAEIYNAKNKILMPGLINTHVHTSQQLGRGIADDVDLLTWLRDRVWPYESSFDYEDSYLSSLACSVELIRSGVTSFLEAGGQYVDAMAQAVSEVGIRASLCKSTMDMGVGLPKTWDRTTEQELQSQNDLFEKFNNHAEGRIKIWYGLRTIFNNSDQLITETKKLADFHRTGIHMHVGEIPAENDFVRETRGSNSTVEHLCKLGLLDDNLLAVHTVWLTPREIDLFKLYNVKVSHNPAAAMKVLGFADIPEMLHKGIPVSIGTDGAPSNNRMDMMREIYLASMIHKGRRLDPQCVPAEEILKMATINGAKCSLLDNIGSLEIGKKADMIILNPRTIHSMPMHDLVSNIVYAMSSENIESTIVDGKWIMKEKEILVLDEGKLLEQVIRQAEKVMKKSKVTMPDRFPTIEF